MRKEIRIDVQDRDNTLSFVIREMPATKQIKWASRALLLLSKGKLGGTMNDVQALFSGNSANIFSMLAGIDYDDAEPLMAELLSCCHQVVSGREGRLVEQEITLATADGLIEDARTLFKLEMESFKLNFGFFIDGGK